VYTKRAGGNEVQGTIMAWFSRCARRVESRTPRTRLHGGCAKAAAPLLPPRLPTIVGEDVVAHGLAERGDLGVQLAAACDGWRGAGKGMQGREVGRLGAPAQRRERLEGAGIRRGRARGSEPQPQPAPGARGLTLGVAHGRLRRRAAHQRRRNHRNQRRRGRGAAVPRPRRRGAAGRHRGGAGAARPNGWRAAARSVTRFRDCVSSRFGAPAWAEGAARSGSSPSHPRWRALGTAVSVRQRVIKSGSARIVFSARARAGGRGGGHPRPRGSCHGGGQLWLPRRARPSPPPTPGQRRRQRRTRLAAAPLLGGSARRRPGTRASRPAAPHTARHAPDSYSMLQCGWSLRHPAALQKP
jgi:hypothetical protein